MKNDLVRLAIFSSLLLLEISQFGIGVFGALAVAMRWFDYYLFDILHELSIFHNNSTRLSLLFAAATLTALISLYGIGILISLKTNKRNWFITFWTIITVVSLIFQIFSSIMLYTDIPTQAVMRKSASARWSNFTVNKKLKYQNQFKCCGFANSSDRAEKEGLGCALYADQPCEVHLLDEEKTKWIPVQSLCFLPPIISILEIILQLILNYCVTQRVIDMEIEEQYIRRPLLRRPKNSNHYRSPSEQFDSDIAKWKKMLVS